MVKKIIRISLALLMLAHSLIAMAETLDGSLGETIIHVKKPGLLSIELEATLFKPPGDGPFPLLIINHGKAEGNPAFQSRARYPVVVREFIKRGFAVILPMRQGFSKSGGAYIGVGCNIKSNGDIQADDVVATLNYAKTLPHLDARRVVVIGQSHGGLTTLAVGAKQIPEVVGLINFAGGLRNTNCNGWEKNLVRAFSSYGSETKIPSLWFYGDNDSYWSPDLIDEMSQAYIQAGGKAEVIRYGKFEGDSHSLFGKKIGLPIWLPKVDQFLSGLGFDTRERIQLPNTQVSLPATASEVTR